MNPADRTITEILATTKVFAIPLHDEFRGITVREGILMQGPAGWAEFAPFTDYDDHACLPWLQAALDTAQNPWPAMHRTSIEVNTTVAVVSPDRAAELVAASGCRTAKVKVGGLDGGVLRRGIVNSLDADAERLAAVRDALGPAGKIRIDANAGWSVDEAVRAIPLLDAAAHGLEYVEQPCAGLDDMATVRRSVGVPIAADESIRRAEDPMRVVLAGAADLAVVKVAPLGGVRQALRIAEATGLPIVVSSAVDTAVGLAAGLALAGALPELDFACGLGTASLLAGDVSSARQMPTDGRLPVPAAAPQPDRLAEFEAGRDRTAYWLARLQRVAALLPAARINR
ncbi:O-succinylbenzoate synthase [Nakamurella panacisegetis]|uniref:o-succinylbenzoate synthase n=1 Tax=Nakamurella panacisegetis TaxID=1090615 RepID=A0A1H0NT84_9ACTN|nr:o-succinylbenzoate synthase [Nakamurella panacisegetis]SDO95879.1 O-succinylbenzoate synthase [Nakamurella panacisegetis]